LKVKELDEAYFWVKGTSILCNISVSPLRGTNLRVHDPAKVPGEATEIVLEHNFNGCW